jgi:predicted negative regulator of RcsB-dependent stress response
MVEHSNVGFGETLESVKRWSRRNGGVIEMVDILATLESEKWWTFSNVGFGEVVEHNHDCGCSKIGEL